MIKTADVIVIGSGIVGSATAYELAKRGKSVLVLEKYPNVGDGASSRNGAGVRLAGRVSPEAELAAMAIYDIWPTLGEELDADLEYVVGGSLTMAHSESQMKSLQVKLAKDLKANVPSRIVDGNEAREICPILSDYVEQALYSEMDGHANPMVTTLAYYRAARRLGVDYITGENVIALEKMHGCCRKVLTEAGNVYEAEHIVLAAGFNSRRIAKTVGLWIPFLKRVDECLITEVQPPMTKVRLSSADGNFYGSQTKHGSFIFGGNTNLERYEECYDDRPINTGKQSPDKCRAIGKFIPALKDVKVVRHWGRLAGLHGRPSAHHSGDPRGARSGACLRLLRPRLCHRPRRRQDRDADRHGRADERGCLRAGLRALQAHRSLRYEDSRYSV